jgi:hypothetical protein
MRTVGQHLVPDTSRVSAVRANWHDFTSVQRGGHVYYSSLQTVGLPAQVSFDHVRALDNNTIRLRQNAGYLSALALIFARNDHDFVASSDGHFAPCLSSVGKRCLRH